MNEMRKEAKIIPISNAWAKNQVNCTIIRMNAITSFKNIQIASFYNEAGEVLLARRNITDSKSTEWEIFPAIYHDRKKRIHIYKGNPKDAHNVISIGIDGDGYLHMSWGHHCDPLNYAKSINKITEGNLQFSKKQSMTRRYERKVTYPEFYSLPNGDMFFFYRDGRSGDGDLMLNRYILANKKWVPVQRKFIDGQKQRNAYWQVTIDHRDHLHISWCWRETGEASTNHDICYAKSENYGKTWKKSDGTEYKLPITQENAEYARKIPQGSSLANTTSMTTDKYGNPYVVDFWCPDNSKIPQYFVVHHNPEQGWITRQVTNRKSIFELKGRGTLRPVISRPRIFLDHNENIYVLFRDDERGNKVSLAVCKDINEDSTEAWEIFDISDESIGDCEPSYDINLWKSKEILNVFVQNVNQKNFEQLIDAKSSMIKIFEWKP